MHQARSPPKLLLLNEILPSNHIIKPSSKEIFPILRVLSYESTIHSILWKLCCDSEVAGGHASEQLQVAPFMKVDQSSPGIN